MDTKNLIELYKSYFKYGKQLQESIVYGISNYNFDNLNKFFFELSLHQKDNFKADRILKTNSQKEYKFYPNSIIAKIEAILRFQHKYHKIIFITDQLNDKKRNLYISNSDNYSYIVGNSCEDDDFLCAIEKNLCNKTYIHGYPNTLHQLASNKKFIKKNRHNIIGFINTDCPAFINKSILSENYIHLNDQMIDWTSGINFYTCKLNYKHFLPIFVKTSNGYKNLLNLSQSMYTNDDFFSINENPILCSCGKYRCQFEFVPHKNNYLCYNNNYEQLLSYANVLSQDIRVFQIIQNKDIFNIFVKTNNKKELSKDIISFFENKFKSVIWNFDKSFRIGFKYPAFWKINKNITI